MTHSDVQNPTSQPSEAELLEIESNFIELNTSFESVASCTDPVTREYKIISEAKHLDIPLDSYRRMFEAYQTTVTQSSLVINPALKPVSWLDHRLGDFVDRLKDISIVRLAILIGEATLLLAMLSYVTEAPQRKQQAIEGARNDVLEQGDRPYSSTRLKSLMFLNRECADFPGFAAPNADLAGLQLNYCYRLHITPKSFTRFPPQLYRYQGMSLPHSNLEGANLEGANLKGANLEGANLKGANLEGANLKGANLEGANLEGANLRLAHLQNANLETANLKDGRLSRTHLQGANLKFAQLQNARLVWADLKNANLAETNLAEANLSHANLVGTDLYKANLEKAQLGYADFRDNAILIGTNLKGANLKAAKFSSVQQVERSLNWDKAIKDSHWASEIRNPQQDTFKIGLVKNSRSSVFKAYEQGIKEAYSDKLIVVRASGIKEEESAINDLIDSEVNVIILRPQDPELSAPAIRKAYNSGVVVMTVGDCMNSLISKHYVFGCYESDSFKMGYDSGKALITNFPKRRSNQTANIGLIDGANSSRVYPYFTGFMAALRKSNISWKIVGSTDAQTPQDLSKVKEMLQKNPEINVLWGGSDATTELALAAVQQMGLQKRVLVYGILDLTRDKAEMLLDPDHPLQSLVDEAPRQAAKEAVQDALTILKGQVRPYKYHVFPHQIIGQDDDQLIQQLLNQLEENSQKPADKSELNS